jgi:hypothetical protein
METTRTLSAARVLDRTQPTDEPSRRTVEATREPDAVSEFRLLIGGKLVEGAGTLDVINPATGRVPTTAPRADRSQLDQAVAAAKATGSFGGGGILNLAGATLVLHHSTVARGVMSVKGGELCLLSGPGGRRQGCAGDRKSLRSPQESAAKAVLQVRARPPPPPIGEERPNSTRADSAGQTTQAGGRPLHPTVNHRCRLLQQSGGAPARALPFLP